MTPHSLATPNRQLATGNRPGPALAEWAAMPKRTNGLIFDIDGTLVDSNDLHAEAWQEAFREFGVEFPYQEIRAQMGKGADLLVPDMLNAKQSRKFGKELQGLRAKLFRRKYLPRVLPFPGVRATLEKLKSAHIKLALASSSDPEEVKYYVQLLEIGDLIEGSTSKGDAEYSKPSPEIFQAALKKIGTDEALTATVGDTPYDIMASHRAALPVIAVLCGGFAAETLAKAEFLLDDIQQIPGRIQEIDAYFNDSE